MLALIARQQPDLIDTVQVWSDINTHSENLEGLAFFADTVVEYAKPLSFLKRPASAVQAINKQGDSVPLAFGDNLYAHVRPDAPIQILLTGHMDTVFPVSAPFQKSAWLDASTLNGPGVADMKGGLLVMLTALAAVEASGMASRLGYQIVLNSDEEVSSAGSAALLVESAHKAQLGLVYEPSALPDGTLAGARKGIGSYAIIARGTSAHAGRNPEQGHNAVLAVAAFFVQANTLTVQRDGLTINVARVDGGGPTNVVPDLAVGRFEVRVWTREDRLWIEAQLEILRAEIARAHDVSMELTGSFHRPPKPLDRSSLVLFEAVRACAVDLNMKIDWQSSGGCCDGNNLAAAGLPVVDTLGVRGGAIHSEKEYLLVDSLVERAQLSALLLVRLASGQIAVPPRVIDEK
jgi:glutamate carboxypeptidase